MVMEADGVHFIPGIVGYFAVDDVFPGSDLLDRGGIVAVNAHPHRRVAVGLCADGRHDPRARDVAHGVGGGRNRIARPIGAHRGDGRHGLGGLCHFGGHLVVSDGRNDGGRGQSPGQPIGPTALAPLAQSPCHRTLRLHLSSLLQPFSRNSPFQVPQGPTRALIIFLPPRKRQATRRNGCDHISWR